jgi:type IV pilus assembly protein PilB
LALLLYGIIDTQVKTFDNKSVDERTFSLSGMSSPVEIVDQVIAQAVRLSASDILFEPQEKEVTVRLRVDGVLQTFGVMPHGSYDQVISRIKVLGNMDVTENRKPQESKIRVDIEDHPYVLRASIVSTNFGQMIALRVLDAPRFTEFNQLGMSQELSLKIKKNIAGRYGLFLVCGPTGSGKTTTVHSCLKHLNNGEVNIMTLEDPIEYLVPGINQIQVGEEIGLDFASGLKMVLRLNPDIVFVGEIRDAETARIAVQASLTGHLVISTIHARNSVGALYRLVDLGVDRYMINYALRAILSQRLMRRVCEHCQEEYRPEFSEIEMYVKEKGAPPGRLVYGRGCEMCNQSRYRGRVGIFELMEINDDIRQLVSSGSGETEFKQELEKAGFVGLPKEGLRLVDEGVTSLPEFIRTMYDAR